MASMCRSAALAAVRSSSLRSQILLPKASTSRLASPLFCRSLASALGTVDSLRPLHNAVASARLISNIAVDSSCWSWPSQAYIIAMGCSVSLIYDSPYLCDQVVLASCRAKFAKDSLSF